MSAKPLATVDVQVRPGDTNRARAGRGANAATASSTNSPYQAAIDAAAKYHRCSTARIVVIFVKDGAQGEPIHFRAEKHAHPVSVITIEFEDRGQDFITWEIVAETGQIIDCHPFQYRTWAKCRVLHPETLAEGQYPAIETGEGEQLVMKYRVEKLTRKGGRR